MMITMLTKTTMMMTMMTTTATMMMVMMMMMMMMKMMMMALIMSTPITADISLEFLHCLVSQTSFRGETVAKCQLFYQAKFRAEASNFMSQCNQLSFNTIS